MRQSGPGTTVAVAGAGGQGPVIAEAGFRAFATSDPPAADGPGRVRDLTPLEAPDRAAAEQEFAENFASRGARRHASVLPGIIDEFRPDLVVRDEADLGAAVAAEARGLPTASVLVLAAGTLIRPDLVLPRLSAVRSEHGLSAAADPARPRELVLSPFPPSLRASGALPTLVDLAYRSRPPVVRRERATLPAIYLTLGTVFGASSGDLLERLLAGLAQVPARTTVAVGSTHRPRGLRTSTRRM